MIVCLQCPLGKRIRGRRLGQRYEHNHNSCEKQHNITSDDARQQDSNEHRRWGDTWNGAQTQHKHTTGRICHRHSNSMEGDKLEEG